MQRGAAGDDQAKMEEMDSDTLSAAHKAAVIKYNSVQPWLSTPAPSVYWFAPPDTAPPVCHDELHHNHGLQPSEIGPDQWPLTLNSDLADTAGSAPCRGRQHAGRSRGAAATTFAHGGWA